MDLEEAEEEEEEEEEVDIQEWGLIRNVIVNEKVEANIMELEKEIEYVLKGIGGDKFENWMTPLIPPRFLLGAAFDLKDGAHKCKNCKINLCCVGYVIRRNEYICSTCTELGYFNKTEDILEGDAVVGYSYGVKFTTYAQVTRIYGLRNNLRSVMALLTLLGGLNQHKLPYELIRTLKAYLY